MNECKGAFGVLFGHKFREAHDTTPPEHVTLDRGSADEMVKVIEALTTRRVARIYCVRCGVEAWRAQQ